MSLSLPSPTPSMCGRFACSLSPEAIKENLRNNNINPSNWVDQDKYEGTYNVAPTYFIPVVRHSDDKYLVQSMRWGLIPFWSKTKPDVPTINARDDSLTIGKPMFRTCKNDKRCIVVAEGYYEWLTPKSGGKKIPHYVKREDGNLLFFAALYDVVKLEGSQDTIFSCTIVTTSCSKQLSFLHDRMPVIFDSDSKELHAWMDNTKGWDNSTLGILLKPYEKKLACYPVTPEVGRVGKSSPDFVTPVAQLKGSLGRFFAKTNSSQGSQKSENTQKSENAEEKRPIKMEDAEIRLSDDLSLQHDSTAIKSEEAHKTEQDVKQEGHHLSLPIKCQEDSETEHDAKREEDDIFRAIALSLQEQNNSFETNLESTSHKGDSRGIKRELDGAKSPERAKHRRTDPAKQMKSPSKSPAKKGLDKANSNKKITSFFTKS